MFGGPISTWTSDETARSAIVTSTEASEAPRRAFPSTSRPRRRTEGRFFQHITPVPDSEHLAQQATGEGDKIGFAAASGGYFLETNGGGVWGGYAPTSRWCG
jgi:hypothetical protein